FLNPPPERGRAGWGSRAARSKRRQLHASRPVFARNVRRKPRGRRPPPILPLAGGGRMSPRAARGSQGFIRDNAIAPFRGRKKQSLLAYRAIEGRAPILHDALDDAGTARRHAALTL